ncbi:MAG TPA: tetratricopeptide repeat protein, partial [Chitinophagales bacterium]|nr:tetratricopeptide repeat protein [Chitinophagales bacterium]
MMKRLVLFSSLLFLLQGLALAQAGRDETLANSYMQNGELDKAAELFHYLWDKNNNDLKYYLPLYKCLLSLKKYDDLEKVVKKQARKNENDPRYIVDLGYLYAQIPDQAKAKDQYEKALKEMKPYEPSIRGLANAFEAYRLYDYVIEAYQRGGRMVHNESYFSMEIANAYLANGDIQNAVKNFITTIELKPGNEQLVKNAIQGSASESKLLDEMETQLYTKVQRNPNNEDYIELLTWIYIQNKDFDGALAQMKALDRRKNENGARVLNIAQMAQTEGDYTAAIAGYEYVVNKGKDNFLYFQARTELLNCRKEKISKNVDVTQDDLLGLKN